MHPPPPPLHWGLEREGREGREGREEREGAGGEGMDGEKEGKRVVDR